MDGLQAVLDACPSKRLGFYTSGDRTVTVYDRTQESAINDRLQRGGSSDFPMAVNDLDADIGTIKFPALVHSVSG